MSPESRTWESLVTIGMKKSRADVKDHNLLRLLSGTDGGQGVALAPEGMVNADIMNIVLLTLEAFASSKGDFKDVCIEATRSALDDFNSYKIGLVNCSYLQNLLFDMLKRQQDLSKYLGWMSGVRDLRKEFDQITPRELYIALFHSLSATTQARLAMILAKADIAIPLVYSWSVKRLQDTCPPANQYFYSMANFHLLQEVACVARHPFMMNLGTCAIKGKTKALRELFTSGGLFMRHDVPSSLQQAPGIDVLPDLASETCHRNLTLVDVHRPKFEDLIFSAAVKALLGFSRLVLLHTGAADLSDAAHEEELVTLLAALQSSPSECRVVVFYRDAVAEDDDSEDELFVQQKLNSILQDLLGDRFAFMLKVPDLRTVAAGEDCRQRQWLKRAWQEHEILKELKSATLCPPAPRMAELYGAFHTQIGAQQPARAPHPFSRHIATKLANLAEQQELIKTLFPVTHYVQQLLQLEQEKKKATEDNDIVMCDEIAKKMAAIEQTLTSPRENKDMQAFAEIVAEGGQHLEELHHAIGEWKMKFQLPLMERLCKLRNSQSKSAQHMKEKKELTAAFNESDVSLDSFWQELLLMNAWQVGGVPELHLRQSYVKWLRRGQPVQLLHGNPLTFGFKSSIDENDPHDCLPAILEDMAAELGFKDSPIMVISVLGQQSSGKSTLLNFLFGCSFVTLSGRCTMGLYLSLIRVGEDLVGILDSEGVLSPDATREPVFDAQIAMMALACSHVVVVNSRGEVGKPILNLLQVCLFAIKRLSVCQVKPVVVFVAGQHSTQMDDTKRQQMFASDIYEPIEKGCQELSTKGVEEVQLVDLLQLSPEHFFVMTPAYYMYDTWIEKEQVRKMSQAFADQAIQVRENILSAAKTAAASGCPWSASVKHWYTHAACIWSVLQQNSSELLCFRDVFEAQLACEMKSYMERLEREEVQGSLRSQLDEDLRRALIDLDKSHLEDFKSVNRNFDSLLEERKEDWLLSLVNHQPPQEFARNLELLHMYRPIYRNAVKRICTLFRNSWKTRYMLHYRKKMADDRSSRIVKQVEDSKKRVTSGTLDEAKAEIEKAFEQAGWEKTYIGSANEEWN